ncbi:winged helix-turn-helix domain-containing protein [Oribacterium sp. HCP28S3_H8]|jgi:two-component system alkaline phosphatase synthesis response regulator PhoP|uniref:winged helix-turn-helix domain-containing protein n=1 Tax=Oribacterium sp. HCP28S3_H8 TaxID=3438945 RepID=UPI003051E0EF|nr:winged helix-turn-helix domain-containing protein [Oribacterium sp.]
MIYCVEDDDNIRELVVYTLDSTGLPAKGFPGGREFEAAVQNELPELVLLDIMLPGEDGISLLRRFRASAATKNIPVIMLTAKGAEYDKVQALDIGADDYVTKPFGMMELVSRIKAVLRRANRSSSGSPDMLEVGSIRMDTRKHLVNVDGQNIDLTLKEFELLNKFMMNTEVVLTREQLLTDIWGYDFNGETRTVDVHVRTLRQKLGAAGDMIQTVRGVGYKLVE